MSKKEGGKIFGSGSKAPVAIILLVKNPRKEDCTIHYKDIGEYHTREQKLEIIKNFQSIQGIKDWTKIVPNTENDWLHQSDNTEFIQYNPIGKDKSDKIPIFGYYKNGVVTAQDEWVYNRSATQLAENMKQQITYLNENMHDKNLKNDYDPKQGKYTRDTVSRLLKHGKQSLDARKIRLALYRPFFTQYLYFDWIFNAVWNVNDIMPEECSDNKIILVSWGSELSVLMTDLTPDRHVTIDTKCFPLYNYKNEKKQDSINDEILKIYQEFYKNITIKKEDIFYYVYGILHSPEYKSKFKNNLKNDLPRIPMAPNFRGFSNIGKKLAELHLKFNDIEKYDKACNVRMINKITEKPRSIKFVTNDKNHHAKHPEAVLAINDTILYDDLPKVSYIINGRTPLGWFVERAKTYSKPYKKSGLVNNMFEGMNIDDVIKCIKQLLHVGIETERLINQLPKEFEPENIPEQQKTTEEYQFIDKTSKRRRKTKRH